ncbi:hypothetical protein HJFPF1_10591 [Paramyrothecium foliicola]|nr:hypothetical protein HJFPF1_10591 [Paramyrothecium foliicola]
MSTLHLGQGCVHSPRPVQSPGNTMLALSAGGCMAGSVIMAEALAIVGLVANITQFVELGKAIVTRISDFCQANADTPAVFRSLLSQLSMLIGMCEQHLETSSKSSEPLDGELRMLWTEALRHTREVQDLVSRQLPTPTDSMTTRAWKATKSTKTPKVGKLSPDSATSLRYLPTRTTSIFVGREEFLGTVEKILQPNKVEPAVCVLLGLGGQGKTSLALEYCRREVTRGYFSFIIWFDVTSAAAFHRRFSQIADQLSRILDYVPASPKGAVLITSRHSDCAALGPTVHLSGLQEAQAIELLLNRAQIRTTPQNIAAARDIVTSLGFLPLAIEQSAAFISSRRLPLADFAALYRSRKKRIIAFNSPFLNYRRGSLEDLDEEELSRNEPLNVWTTWELSFEQIGRSTSDFDCDPEALKSFLTQLAFFNKSDIRMQLFKQHWKQCKQPPSWMSMFVDEDDQEWDDFAYQECLFSLQKLSLIQYQDSFDQSPDDGGFSASTTDRSCVSMHTLVRDWIQLRLSPKERSNYSVQALKILSSSIDSDKKGTGLSIGEQQELLAHLDASISAALDLNVGWGNNQLFDLEFCFDNASWLLSIRMKLHGTTSKATLDGEIALSNVDLNQGKYKEVESRMKTALLRQDYAWHSTDIFTCKRLLAFSHFKQGRYEESVATLTSILDDNEPSTGRDGNHTVILDAQELLAQVYRTMGKHVEARSLYNLILSGIDACSEYHVPTRRWHCMVHLANSYRDEALRVRAADLYREAIDGFILHLGPDHPSSLTARLFFAILESDFAVDDFDIPRKILEDVIERLTKVLGPKHVDTIKAISNLAILQHRAHQPDKAELLFRKALAARLVGLLWAKGQADDAEKLALRGLQHSPPPPPLASRPSEISVASFHSNSSATTLVDDALASASEHLFRKAWQREESSLHEAHQNVIDMIESLVVVCKADGQNTTDLTDEIGRRKQIKQQRAV